LDTCGALIRQQKAGIEDACVAAEAELEDARRTRLTRGSGVRARAREQERATLEERHKCTTELDGHLTSLELEVESSSARGSDTAVWLEKRVRALEWELEDVAAEAEVEAEAWVVKPRGWRDRIPEQGVGGDRRRPPK
jgi:hypothetical protein